MLPQEIIRKKRDGEVLTDEEIAFLVQGVSSGTLTEGQIAAFTMAVYFQGMNMAERVALTRLMTRSGRVLDWSALKLPGPILDKHSTGGVGDKVSLMLAPLVAACGGYVPMISGRGLGHTGGTLDKLESIPGYQTAPDIDVFQRTVASVGCAIIGQTADLAPADRRLYAIRDVTATVESIPLITASILSKKLAAGLQGLVIDLKTGTGAFLADLEAARQLADSIVSVSSGAGLPATAVLSDMNQVLGNSAGNALEVEETITYLQGDSREPRLHELVMALATEMLILGGLADSSTQAKPMLEQALDSGRAAERFAEMVATLGGPTDLMDHPDRYLDAAPIVRPVVPPVVGWLGRMDVRRIGLAVVALGGGRQTTGDTVDHRVGFSDWVGSGGAVGPDRPLAMVHAATASDAEMAITEVLAVVEILEEEPQTGDVLLGRIAGPEQRVVDL